MTINDAIAGNITNLNGLAQVTAITGFLLIEDNDALTNLSGLNALSSVSGYLSIKNNPTLTGLTDLNSLTAISGYLDISNNISLTSLVGIDNINPTTISNLTIQSSNTLSICSMESICNYLSIPANPASISANAAGCLTRGQVIAYCSDTDTDGVIDSLDNCVTIYNPSQADGDSDGAGDVCDFGSENNVGIGLEAPTTKLHVTGGSIFLDNNSGGILLRSPDNSCWIIRVNDNGTLTSIKVPCPD